MKLLVRLVFNTYNSWVNPHDLAFYLNTDEIIAKVYSLNIGSIKVLENNGFKKLNFNETTRIRTGQLVEEWVFMKNLERHIFR